MTVETYKLKYTFVERLISIHDVSSSRYEATNPAKLLPLAKIWFRLIVTNFRAISDNMNTLTHDEKMFILLLLSNININLAQNLFNFLNESIIVSISRHKSFILFGRLLSTLLYKAGIADSIQSVGSEDFLESFSCEIFEA